MSSFTTFVHLNTDQKRAYRKGIKEGFPNIILQSAVTKKYWDRLEEYFPYTQLFLIDDSDGIIGFMNLIPFRWDKALSLLPDEGWDWMLQKGIEDFENKIKPNCLGGLQVVITDANRGKGFSGKIISAAKNSMHKMGLEQLLIPIRPTHKHVYWEMSMKAYLEKRTEDDRIFDPWIRAHIRGGAELIKVCKKSMHIQGDLLFWEQLLNEKITRSGKYQIEGALNETVIKVEENFGEYNEENIWIRYT